MSSWDAPTPTPHLRATHLQGSLYTEPQARGHLLRAPRGALWGHSPTSQGPWAPMLTHPAWGSHWPPGPCVRRFRW